MRPSKPKLNPLVPKIAIRSPSRLISDGEFKMSLDTLAMTPIELKVSLCIDAMNASDCILLEQNMC